MDALKHEGDVAWAESNWVTGVRSDKSPTPNDLFEPAVIVLRDQAIYLLLRRCHRRVGR